MPKHKLLKVKYKLITQLELEVTTATFTLQVIFCLITLGHCMQFCFPLSRSKNKRQLVNFEMSHLLFPSSPISQKQTCSKLSITSTSYLQCQREERNPWALSQKHRNRPLVQVKQEQVSKWSKQFIFLLACFYIYLPFSLTLPSPNCATEIYKPLFNGTHFCNSGKLPARLYK